MIISGDYMTGKVTIGKDFVIRQGEGEYYRIFVDENITSLRQKMHTDDIARLDAAMAQMGKLDVNAIAVRMTMRGEEYHWVLMILSYSVLEENGSRLIDVSLQDIVPVWSDGGEEKAHISADEDPGTGLLNKRAVTEYAKDLIDLGSPGCNVTIAIIDIDDFKTINDTYGHSFGDEVLIKAAEIIQNAIGDKGVAGRIGGDEMFIVLKDMKSHDEIRLILKEIRTNIEWAYRNGEYSDLVTTCSIGCATYPADADNFADLFNVADKLLYLAKEKGKNRYIIYEEEVHGQYVRGTGEAQERVKDILKYNKLGMVLEIMDGFAFGDQFTLKDICEKIGPCFELEDISIYTGPDWKRQAMWGIFKDEELQIPYIDNPEYLECFDRYNIFAINSLQSIKPRCRQLYDTLASQKISASVHYLIGPTDNPAGLITFNKSKLAKKWANWDIDWLCILAHMIKRRIFGKEY